MADPLELSLGQAIALARLAEAAGEGLFGARPLTDELKRQHSLNVWPDGEHLHVLINPPGRWHSLDRAGAEVAARPATRAETMTVALRASRWWAGMRRLLAGRGVDPSTTALGDAVDDAEGEDIGVLVTAGEAVVEWRRQYVDGDPSRDELLEWRDVTGSWEGGPWADRVREGLDLQRRGFLR